VLAATLAVVAGSLAATGPAFADTTTTTVPAATTTTIPANIVGFNRLHWIKENAAYQIRIRVRSLNAAIKVVQEKPYLGTDGTTLVTGMNSDKTGLEALGTKIAGDTTVKQAAADRLLIFTEFRVYRLVLPVANDVIAVDYTDNLTLPSLDQSITQLKAQINSCNEGVLGPLVSSMETQVQIATAATSGLAAEVLSYTPAQWNANHKLLNDATSDIRAANRAIAVAKSDLRKADRYLRKGLADHSCGTTTTTPSSTTTTSPTTTTTTVPTTTTSTTTSSTTSSTTTTVASPNCSAAASGTVLSRTGWWASTNAPSGSADAPAHAIDGNMKTRFSTDEDQAPGLYLRLNMRSLQTFDQLQMDVPYSPRDYARGYRVEVSADGTSWSTVATCTGVRAPEVVSFPAQTAQYLEVVLNTSNSSWWWSVDELYVRH
jgi:hypothetical protein